MRSHLGWRPAGIASVIVAVSLAPLLASGGEGRMPITHEGGQRSAPTGRPSHRTLLHAPMVSRLVAAALDERAGQEGTGKKGAAVIRRFRARTGCDVYGSVRARQVNPILVHSEVRQFLEVTNDVGVALGQDQVVIVAVICRPIVN